MTVSAGVESLSSAYEEAELRIIDLIASRLKKGAEAPDWATRKLQELALTKRQIQKELNKLAPEAAAQVSQLLRDNYERGQAEALDTLIKSKMETPYPGVIQASKEMSKLLSETTQSILESHNRILRSTDDAYRKIVSRAASDLLLGTGTRSDMIQRGLNEFADKGITGFVDKRGRNWEMKAYVEMAAGTAAHRASTQGHLEKLKENGHNLVVVSDHKGECDQCRKWEGEVLAIEEQEETPEPPIKMTKDEAISWYAVGGYEYRNLNNAYRNKTPLNPTQQAAANALTAAAAPTKPGVLWRGTSLSSLKGAKAGDIISEPAFMSTAVDEVEALTFIEHNQTLGIDPVMLKIRPRGAKSTFISSDVVGVDEHLFPPGTKMRVLSIRSDEEYGKIADVEIVDDTKPSRVTAVVGAPSKSEQIRTLEQRISSELSRASKAKQAAVKKAAQANVQRMRTELQKLKR